MHGISLRRSFNFTIDVVNTVNRKYFVLKIFRAINFHFVSFSYKQPLTEHVNGNNVHAF